VTASDATPFLGDWTLAMDGPNGSATFALSVKVEKDQVVGELSSDTQPRQPIMDVSKRGTSLVLDYQGMAVPVIITLTPDRQAGREDERAF
jgi:hypothetical protein